MNIDNLPVIPIDKFQENFDEYLEDIETNKNSYIIENQAGERAIMMPANEEMIEMYTQHDEGC